MNLFSASWSSLGRTSVKSLTVYTPIWSVPTTRIIASLSALDATGAEGSQSREPTTTHRRKSDRTSTLEAPFQKTNTTPMPKAVPMSETTVPFVDILKVPITKEEIGSAIQDVMKTMEELKANPVTGWQQGIALEKAIRALSTLS